jgi:hypothetical protein
MAAKSSDRRGQATKTNNTAARMSALTARCAATTTGHNSQTSGSTKTAFAVINSIMATRKQPAAHRYTGRDAADDEDNASLDTLTGPMIGKAFEHHGFS